MSLSQFEETYRMKLIPGIEFRDGPTGRRVGIIDSGLDVWEIIALYKTMGDVGIAAYFNWLTEAQIHAALSYYSWYPEDIDRRLREEELCFLIDTQTNAGVSHESR